MCYFIWFFFFNDTAPTEIYTLHIVGSVRCVQETGRQQVEACFFFQQRGLGAHVVERDIDRIAASGKGDGIAAVARRENRDSPIEGVTDAFDTSLETLVPAEQVHAAQTVIAQPAAAGLVERFRVEHTGMPFRIVAIDQNQVEAPVAAQHVVGAATDRDIQAARIIRQLEVLSGNELYLRVDLDDGDPALRQIPCTLRLSLIHISEPTRLGMISYAVFCLKKKKKQNPMNDRTPQSFHRQS
eukprot:TRINITY_DN8049_c0_g1_i1.p2 TRINITY_DN8049_c0_g1~~TRINITY_DN8049_c0_g1_i1.p2  ORF type:complete len:241 (+),score=34.89 TRINITY_DN8049_c0_g1_i1:107-829(+)